MLLAIDIGNTSTKFGLFSGGELVTKFAVPTRSTDLVAAIAGRLDSGFDPAIVCSVVPDAADRLKRLVAGGFGVEPTFIKSEIGLDLTVKHEPASSLGPDRLVNAFSAAETYGTPVIVLSLGTAMTIDVVSRDRQLLGGLIAPGMELMAKSLHEHTAKLPDVDVERTDELLGTTTEDAIRSGIYLCVTGFIETAVAEISKDHPDARVVATGGSASFIDADCPSIDIVDENLTLKGLDLIASRNT